MIMKHASRLACLLLGGLALMLPAGAGAVQGAATAPAAVSFKVLVLTEGNPAVDGAVSVLQRAGQRATPKFNVDQVKNSANGITDNHLKHYNVVVFLNNGAGDVLSAEEQTALEKYFRAGGGFVGIGTAIETNASWQFLTDILGARASGKLPAQDATIKVADRVHDASKSLPEYWNLERHLLQLHVERARAQPRARDRQRRAVQQDG
jgi:cytochrome c